MFYGFNHGVSLSENGFVAGYRRRSNFDLPIDEAVIWDQQGSYRILGVQNSYAQAIAYGYDLQNRPVGGVKLNLSESLRPVVWENGVARFLPAPEQYGYVVSGGTDVLVGVSLRPISSVEFVPRACYWGDFGVAELSGLEGLASFGYSVNANGEYCGVWTDRSDPNGWVFGGFVGSGGSTSRLNYPGFPQPLAFNLNDHGWVVGEYRPPGGRRAFVARGAEAHDLGQFVGYEWSVARAINNDGTIVGEAAPVGGDVERALIWRNGSRVAEDLNLLVDLPPGVTLISGMDVNHAGQIFAEARLDAGGYAYYRLDPVPEPGALLGLGAAAFVLMRRGSRR